MTIIFICIISARTSHIVQVAALRGGEQFNTYIMPKQKIAQTAADVNGIRIYGDKMFLKTKEVQYLTIKPAMTQFIEFLSRSKNNILVGHNAQTFDSLVCVNALNSCHMLTQFEQNCIGFMDTKKMFKKSHPGLKSYTQQQLLNLLLDIDYEAHNAVDDVINLQKLVENVPVDCQHKLNATFPLSYTTDMLHYINVVNDNLPSLTPLQNVVSKQMLRKIAGSGLRFEHLMLAFKRNGTDGVKLLFSEQGSGKGVRVTKSEKIISSVSQFLSNM